MTLDYNRVRVICEQQLEHPSFPPLVEAITQLVAVARQEERTRAMHEERERCVAIVERHPDEAHPRTFNTELVRGCCKAMAARIRSGEQ